MTVYVVTDSTSCLPASLAAEYGITVLDIHTSGQIPGEFEDVTESEETLSDAAVVSMESAENEPEGKQARAVLSEDLAMSSEGSGSDARSCAEPNSGPNSGSDTESDAGPGAELDAEQDAGEDAEQDLPAPEPEEPTTSGLGPLELTATYARLLERGGDDGVVALHLSRELSSTWSSANQAAAVFDGLVEVVDTRTAGMALGQAAIAAARCAADGGSLADCTAAATRVLRDADVWLYVHRLDALARGGRLSTAQRLLSTALAIKPILHLNGGKIELAAKTRTQSKAMSRLVGLIEDAYRKAAAPILPEDPQSAPEAGDRDDTTVATRDGVEASQEPSSFVAPVSAEEHLQDDTTVESAEPEVASSSKVEPERPRVFTFGGEHDFRLRKRREQPVTLAELPSTPMYLDIHLVGCLEVAEDLRDSLRDALPECVTISLVDLSPALLIHTGPQALGVSFVRG